MAVPPDAGAPGELEPVAESLLPKGTIMVPIIILLTSTTIIPIILCI